MNSRLVQTIAALLLVGLVLAASQLTSAINAGREKMNIFGQTSAQTSAPPEYAFAIQAFGAFRGLLTDIAFIRAESLKSDGRYYDAMQLASWICKLQPRFPSVWEFQSWNMAWNISVTTYTPEERWNWVYNGVKLLRDEGIVWNPRAVNLYKQLAWIFNNKMSENIDEFHRAYKRNWAWKMHLVLGAPPDPQSSYAPGEFESVEQQIGDDRLARASAREKEIKDKAKEQLLKENPDWEISAEKVNTASRPSDDPRLLPFRIAQKAAFEFIDAIDKAPRTLPELYAAAPPTAAMVGALKALGISLNDKRINEDDYSAVDGLEHSFFIRYRKLLDRPASLLGQISASEAPDPDAATLKQMGEVLGLDKQDPNGALLVRYLQRKVLNEVYKLDTNKMAVLVRTFGPLDWRVVDAHSLYWVNEGLIAGGETPSQIGNDKTNTARLIFFSLRNLFHRNHMSFEPDFTDPSQSYINYAPDLNFIEPMHEAFFKYGPLIDPEPQTTGAGGTYKTGHVNFLIEAIQLLWLSDRQDEAARYYDYLRQNYAKTDTGDVNHTFDPPLAQFVKAQFMAEAGGNESENEIRDAVNGMVNAAMDALALGNVAQFKLLMARAEVWRGRYNDPKAQTARDRDRLNLLSLDELAADALRARLRAPAAGQVLTQRKARLWKYLDIRPDLKCAVYDDVRSALETECKLWNYDAARAFPEPEKMAEYRSAHPTRIKDAEKPKDIETPAQNVQ